MSMRTHSLNTAQDTPRPFGAPLSRGDHEAPTWEIPS